MLLTRFTNHSCQQALPCIVAVGRYRWSARVCGLVIGVITAFCITPAFAHTPLIGVAQPSLIDQGLLHDEQCSPGYRIAGTAYCTHGPDAPPPPISHRSAHQIIRAAALTKAGTCADEVSGKRVEVLYVRSTERPDHYASSVSSIRGWVAEVDAIFDLSAQATGGRRQIRFVTDADCQVTVLPVVIPAGDEATFGRSIAALRKLGFNNPNRKYLIFMDAGVYCGIATIERDSRPTLDNRNNTTAGYARIDYSCWNSRSVAHELAHTLGGVQLDAPNASGGWHCVDEYDLLCYSDWPNYPATQLRCPNGAWSDLLDCNHDDYYHTNPLPESYLATHWNVANSEFLFAPPTPINQPPTLHIRSPADQNTFDAPAEIVIEVEASDSDGTILAVEFYHGDQLLSADTAAPFTYSWSSPTAGDYRVIAIAYDDGGANSVSTSIAFTVAQPVSGQGEPALVEQLRLYLPIILR